MSNFFSFLVNKKLHLFYFCVKFGLEGYKATSQITKVLDSISILLAYLLPASCSCATLDPISACMIMLNLFSGLYLLFKMNLNYIIFFEIHIGSLQRISTRSILLAIIRLANLGLGLVFNSVNLRV